MDAATATILAALIAAVVSIINMTLNKDQKISEFRQAWLDDLRKDLALFFTCIRAFTRAVQEQKVDEARAWLYKNGTFVKTVVDTTPTPKSPLRMTEEQISKMRFEVAESRYRIRLRLNPKESDHKELMELMQSGITTMQTVLDFPVICNNLGEFEIFNNKLQHLVESTMNSIENTSDFSTGVLKKEWNIVKQGEPAFRIIRNFILPIVLIIGLATLILKLSGVVLF